MRRRPHPMGGDVYTMSTDILLNAGYLVAIDRAPTDVTGVPPEASLIAEALWADLCKEAGGEAALIAELGVIDTRAVDDVGQ